MLSLIELGPARHNSRNPSRLDQRPPPPPRIGQLNCFRGRRKLIEY